MSVRLTRVVLFHRTACAVFALSFAATALLAAPTRAQRGRSAPASRPASPPMRAPMPRPQMPRMSPPMRRGPMREPAPARRGPANTPRNGPIFGSPRPISHARPTGRMPRGGAGRPMNPDQNSYRPMSNGKFGARRATPGPAPRYIPTTRTLMPRPVFTPTTSTALRGRSALLQSFRNRVYRPVYTSPGYAWGGYSYNPYFPGFTPAFGDPFLDLSFYWGTNCFGYSPMNDFTFDPFAAEFAYPVFANPFCGAMFTPSLFSPPYFWTLGMPFGSNPLCPTCGIGAVNPFAFGLDSGFLDAFSVPPAALPSFSDSTFATPPGNISASPSEEGLVNTSSSAGLSTTPISDAPFTMNHPPLDHPLTLVFANGSTAQATRYWLASDLKLHYVTPSGSQMAIPLAQFDMSATMKANRKDGIRFLPQSSAQPESGSTRR